MRTVLALAALAASALAYQVTEPSQTQGWTTVGPNIVTWDRVSTDATNFTLVLTNQNRNLLPTDEILVAFVDGTTGKQTASEPSAGWPVGTGFRVNLVQDTQHLSTIYAQSSEFAIAQSTSSIASSSTVAASSAAASQSALTAAAASGTGTGSITAADLNPTNSQTDTTPSGTANGAVARAAFGSPAVLALALALGVAFA